MFLSLHQDLAMDVCVSGDPAVHEFDVATYAGQLYVQRGVHLSAGWCDYSEDEAVVWRTFAAVSGDLTLSLDPVYPDSTCEAYDAPVHATLELSGVVLEAEDDDDVTAVIEGLVWTDVLVGWLPG
jgi:hypothetical protein